MKASRLYFDLTRPSRCPNRLRMIHAAHAAARSCRTPRAINTLQRQAILDAALTSQCPECMSRLPRPTEGIQAFPSKARFECQACPWTGSGRELLQLHGRLDRYGRYQTPQDNETALYHERFEGGEVL